MGPGSSAWASPGASASPDITAVGPALLAVLQVSSFVRRPCDAHAMHHQYSIHVSSQVTGCTFSSYPGQPQRDASCLQVPPSSESSLIVPDVCDLICDGR